MASLTEKNQILNAEMDQKVNLLKGIQEVLDKRGGGGGAPLGSYKLEETVFEDAVGMKKLIKIIPD